MTLPFVVEADDARPELPYGVQTTLSVWPKQNGQLVSNITSATYSIRGPDGTVYVPAGTAATVTSVTYGDRTVGRLDVSMPDFSLLDQDFVLEVAWVKSDGTRGTEVVLFDVCRVPLGSLISLNDFIEGYAEVEGVLINVANRMGLGAQTDQVKAETVAQVYASGARAALQEMLEGRADRDGKPRPGMLLDRRKVSRLERHLALRDLFGAVARAPLEDMEDPDSGRYRFHATEASRLFDSMRIGYDLDEDGTQDGVTNFGAVFTTARGRAK